MNDEVTVTIDAASFDKILDATPAQFRYMRTTAPMPNLVFPGVPIVLVRAVPESGSIG